MLNYLHKLIRSFGHWLRLKPAGSETAKTLFAEIGSRYDDIAGQSNWQAPTILFNQLAPCITDQEAPLNILDVGAGTGQLSALFRRTYPAANITAVDLSAQMLDQIDKEMVDCIVEQDVQKDGLPFAKETFNIVSSCGMFEYINQPQDVISEMVRVLVPGGILAFTTQQDPQLFVGDAFLNIQSLEKTKALLEQVGLTIIDALAAKAYDMNTAGPVTYNFLTAQKPTLPSA